LGSVSAVPGSANPFLGAGVGTYRLWPALASAGSSNIFTVELQPEGTHAAGAILGNAFTAQALAAAAPRQRLLDAAMRPELNVVVPPVQTSVNFWGPGALPTVSRPLAALLPGGGPQAAMVFDSTVGASMSGILGRESGTRFPSALELARAYNRPRWMF